jgi:hypothetical protein
LGLSLALAYVAFFLGKVIRLAIAAKERHCSLVTMWKWTALMQKGLAIKEEQEKKLAAMLAKKRLINHLRAEVSKLANEDYRLNLKRADLSADADRLMSTSRKAKQE